jgi:hypothetical protein
VLVHALSKRLDQKRIDGALCMSAKTNAGVHAHWHAGAVIAAIDPVAKP